MTWTDEKMAEAAKMWRSGASSGQIAISMRTSRSAICGIASRHRDMFPERGRGSQTPKSNPRRPQAPYPRGMSAQPKTASAIDVPVIRAVFEAAKSPTSVNDLGRFRIAGRVRIAFAELTSSQCRFPLECMEVVSGPETPCCGAKTEGPLSGYCGAHRSIMRKVA